MPVISIRDIIDIVTHVKMWVVNLKRAKKERKDQSIEALQAVILAVRETIFYLSEIRDKGERSRETEHELTKLWTELSFKVAKLKLDKLRDQCNSLGRYWSDPAVYSLDKFQNDLKEKKKDFETLRGRLEDIEGIAQETLQELI